MVKMNGEPKTSCFNLFSLLPLTGATKALCICVALAVKMDSSMDNCIEFALVSLKTWFAKAFPAVTQLTLGPCVNGFINATVLGTAALTGSVESQPDYLAIFSTLTNFICYFHSGVQLDVIISDGVQPYPWI